MEKKKEYKKKYNRTSNIRKLIKSNIGKWKFIIPSNKKFFCERELG